MINSNKVRWTQLTIGHLSRNKFWGEDPDTQYHSVVASTVLVQDGDVNILFDPTLPADEMERRLKLYCGLTREDIDIIFASHFHTDHRFEAEKYPNAKLYMSAESVQEVLDVQKEGGFMAKAFINGAIFDFTAAPEQISPNVKVVPLPGHTLGLAGLMFTDVGRKILLSGDTIMNREFYNAREGYFIDASQESTGKSMSWAYENVDIIVPGHGDWFYANETVSDCNKNLTWRKLNLCAKDTDGLRFANETNVLIQSENENIIINPTLSGDLLRDAIYDAKGLDPADITRVICLKRDPMHTRDVLTMKKAKLYLPKWMLSEKPAENDMRKLDFEAWEKTDEMQIDIIEIGTSAVCVFNSGDKRIAVSSDVCDSESLVALGVNVAIVGGEVRILQ